MILKTSVVRHLNCLVLLQCLLISKYHVFETINCTIDKPILEYGCTLESLHINPLFNH